MSTKPCPKCGWIYPLDYPELRCRFCGTKFNIRRCARCGEIKDTSGAKYCKECARELNREKSRRYYKEHNYESVYYRRIKEQQQKQLSDWLALINRVQPPLKTLTEDEWLTACRYFDKCAFCKTDEISARGFFIPYKMGGRYAAWNVLPVCEQCATVLKRLDNPFTRYARRAITHYSTRHVDKDCLKHVTSYLLPILKEAAQDVSSEDSGV